MTVAVQDHAIQRERLSQDHPASVSAHRRGATRSRHASPEPGGGAQPARRRPHRLASQRIVCGPRLRSRIRKAYRIAQEALTNALKHAPGSTARIRLDYRSDVLAIEVTDDGPGMSGTRRGHGLIGMRERAELYGGTLDAGNEPGGGFGVRALLPLREGTTR